MSFVLEVALSLVARATISLSAVGGALMNSSYGRSERAGMHIVLGAGGSQVLVPLAPGLVTWVGVSEHRRLAMDDIVRFQPGIGTVALVGERELELSTTSVVEVGLCAAGQCVVVVPGA